LLPDAVDRKEVLAELKRAQVDAVFHYVPLHESPAGKRYGRAQGLLTKTEALSQRLIRLPLWTGITEAQQEQVCFALTRILESAMTKRTGSTS
jgi:dTDP-4-amino-4,6-dideoxygalactose transaminase